MSADDRDDVPETAAERDGRPVIRMTTDLHKDVDAAIDALASSAALYARDGALVHVTNATREDVDAAGPALVIGTPVIRTMRLATLIEELTRTAVFERSRPSRKVGAPPTWVASLPSDAIVRAVHSRGEWRGIRTLVGIIETPSMRPDGSVIDVPGYDGQTGYLYLPREHFPAVPRDPTKEDAAKALEELAEIFCDFPFATEAAAHVPIAAILTLIARPAIRGAIPGILNEAPTRGTGKTLEADAICVTATGRESPRGTFPTHKQRGCYVVSDEELEKILSAYALRGAAVVGFDNLPGIIGGAPLDKVLTAVSTVDMRVLGASDMRTLVWQALVLASGNNVAICGDTARRMLVSRLESPLERPEERTQFKHAPLLPWVRENRPRLVAAALTVLRAFVVAGRPDQGIGTWGSFEEWTALIAQAIVFAGGANVLDARPRAGAGDDGEIDTLADLLRGWQRLEGGGAAPGLTARRVLELLYPELPRGERRPPDGLDDLREAIEAVAPGRPGRSPEPKDLGDALRRCRGRVVAGLRLVCSPGGSRAARWFVVGGMRGLGGHEGSVTSGAQREHMCSLPTGTGDDPPSPPVTPHVERDEDAELTAPEDFFEDFSGEPEPPPGWVQ